MAGTGTISIEEGKEIPGEGATTRGDITIEQMIIEEGMKEGGTILESIGTTEVILARIETLRLIKMSTGVIIRREKRVKMLSPRHMW